ncbi:MAG: efflux transporter outer membrane subunit [Sedimentisphaerales bacterium]|nr:efflux transporter outer membrane subunit [Sedimentisphaerales bacterium]
MKVVVAVGWRVSVLVAVSVVVSGCMMGPDYSRPQTPADTAHGFVNAPPQPAEVNEVTTYDQWWERFGDAVTAELVREALANNYDLKAAAARVLQSQEALAQARGQLWPDVSYDISRLRSKQYFNVDLPGFPPGGFNFLNTTWTQGFNVSYMVDFWGQLRRSEKAAWADLLAAEFNRQALINSVVATVIEARTNIAAIQNRLAIVRASTESRVRTVEITERRYEAGLVSPVDAKLARAALEGARAQEPALELSLVTARHALDVLLARAPGTSASLPETLDDLPSLEPVPAGMPAALIERRPDVRAAEFSLRAANERIGASIAQLYPGLVLSASYGSSSDAWADLWQGFSETYSALFTLTQPVFQGGRLRAQVRAAKAAYEAQAADYGNTVLTAMREVEDALVSEKYLRAQLEHAERQLAESREAETLSRRRYDQGVEGILTVLESERQRLVAEEQVAMLRGQIWSTRVSLHLALGGDWAEASPTREVARR